MLRVPMMFAEMAAAHLYPPQYRQNTETATECVTVTLLNMERPTVWDEVAFAPLHLGLSRQEIRDRVEPEPQGHS